MSISLSLILLAASAAPAEGVLGTYRHPSLHEDQIVFTAEGDLWRVGIDGGLAHRLTSGLEGEGNAAISPDGSRIAFTAAYGGPNEVWVMPINGGLPERLTWIGEGATVLGWTAGGEVLYRTYHGSSLLACHVRAIDPESKDETELPLRWASEATEVGDDWIFTRFEPNWSQWKRYRGGRMQRIWRFDAGAEEAYSLTPEEQGLARWPMIWDQRIVFASDADGTVELWSMDQDGGDRRQLTEHEYLDIHDPAIEGSRVIFQLGSDLAIYDLDTGVESTVPIRLSSDLEQRRPRVVADVFDMLSSAHISDDGGQVALTARGQIVVAPSDGEGRRVQVTDDSATRWRDARFLPGGDQILALGDSTGEVELWLLDPRGLEPAKQLSNDTESTRFRTWPSPDGRFIVSVDREHQLWLYDTEDSSHELIARSIYFGFNGLTWSPDSRFLAWAQPGENTFTRLWLFDTEDDSSRPLSSDRWNVSSPAFSADGAYLFFLSERHIQSSVGGPWGAYAPQPNVDKATGVFGLALEAEGEDPFASPTELDRDANESEDEEADEDEGIITLIDFDGLQERLFEMPLPTDDRWGLFSVGSHLYWLAGSGSESRLESVEIAPNPEITEVEADVQDVEASTDGKHLLVRKASSLLVFDANGKAPADRGEAMVPLPGWRLNVDPRFEWRQMLQEAWRLHRDYFYDPAMHGVDWEGVLERAWPRFERITDRAELSQLFADLVGELSASHQYVRGGDHRDEALTTAPASLGGRYTRSESGFVVTGLYQGDPELPNERSPLREAGVEVGETIVAVDGRSCSGAPALGALLEDRVGVQVLLDIEDTSGDRRQVIVEPIDFRSERMLRHIDWVEATKTRVDERSEGRIGYVHVRSMGTSGWSDFARHFFPQYQRQGLIVDVRGNGGGNIDSWILGYLIRRPWMWWSARRGMAYSNMQYAFGGHMTVLCDEHAWSDGEAFCEGFRSLGLGPVVGSRSGGGEIWLTSSNRLVDEGIATAPEFGVFGPDGEWLIEGHGVEPDIEVDNLPHATYNGADAQLEAAIADLEKRIAADPPTRPDTPAFRDKSVPSNQRPSGENE